MAGLFRARKAGARKWSKNGMRANKGQAKGQTKGKVKLLQFSELQRSLKRGGQAKGQAKGKVETNKPKQ